MVAAAAPEYSQADEDRLALLLRAQHNAETLDAFIRRVSPRHVPPKHMHPVHRLWERSRHERVLACIEMPPRHGKTTETLHGIAWKNSVDPVLLNAFATFGDDYAASRSRIARMLTKAGGRPLSKEMANLHEWLNDHGGGAQFRGYLGEWTGRGITGVGVVDDPYKDRASAESPKIRKNIQEWFADVWWTRFEWDFNPSCFVVHTRWHEDDLIGWLLSGKFGVKFERIRLPAIAEEGDLLGREVGEALWPERFTVEMLREIEAALGPYSWASLYQQRPRPRGANVFDTIKAPARFALRDWRPDGHRILICADPAATEDTRADHSALFVLAAKEYGLAMLIWILYGWRDHVSVPAFARKLHRTSQLFWNAPIVVEAVGGFKAVPQTLKEIEPRLRLLIAKMGDPSVGDKDAARISNAPVDKFLRAQPAAAAWNRSRILVPMDAHLEWNPATERFERPVVYDGAGNALLVPPRSLRRGVAPGVTWADELITEAGRFTGAGDAEDDQIDALSHGFNELMGIRQRQHGERKNSNPFG